MSNRASPSTDEVRAELDRILSSSAFTSAGRLARLLRYVVERSLAGEGDQLKEYVLGVEVFDRGDQYDPRLDSIVRVEARRLRARLEEYYRNAGATDAVVITIPRGSYAPVFEHRPPESRQVPATPRSRPRLIPPVALALGALAAVAVVGVSSLAFRSTILGHQQPAIAVLPFEEHSGTAEDQRLASRLTDTVTTELARLGSVSVVSRWSARQFDGARIPLREIAQRLDVNLVMECTLEARGDRLRVTARLVNATNDRKVWAEVFEAPAEEVGLLARRVAASAAQAALNLK